MMEVDLNRGWHKFGCVRIGDGETYPHALAKFQIAWAYRTLDYTQLPKKIAKQVPILDGPVIVITEAKMTNGREVDVLIKQGANKYYIEVETGKSYKKEKDVITVLI